MTVLDVLKKADAGRYAVGAFNCNDLMDLQAIAQAAEAEKAPAIMMASSSAVKFAGAGYLVAMYGVAAKNSGVPLFLQLDHGTKIELVEHVLRAGFNSIMFDGSKLPYQENVRLTKEVVKMAHARGVPVEGELGRLVGTEDDITVEEREAAFTDPALASDFVEKTGVDVLAISIGTAHGFYKGEPKLDFERLEKIDKAVDAPLVLHGGTGVPDESIRRAISLGINKLNVGTQLKYAYTQAVRKTVAELTEKDFDFRRFLTAAREALVEVVREKIRLAGSSGKA